MKSPNNLLLLLLVLLFVSSTALAQTNEIQPQPTRLLQELLNFDGTIKANTGYEGSLDPTGWRMQYAENGAPRFLSSKEADTAWPGAAPVGVNSSVWAIRVVGSDVYIGGDFTNAGGNPNADGIARWNASSQTWNALGSGIAQGVVHAILDVGSFIYVGGSFMNAGGLTNASGLARWSASTGWQVMPGGPVGLVRALAADANYLYAGGLVVMGYGPLMGDRIARWNLNTQTWSGFGSSVSINAGSVLAIAIIGNRVYVGGQVTQIGGIPGAIAYWDTTTNTWNSLGSGASAGLVGNVWAIGRTMVNGEVYIGGQIAKSCSNGLAVGIVRYRQSDGSWWALGPVTTGHVFAIDIHQGGDLGTPPRWYVYAGGFFYNNAVVLNATCAARWNVTTQKWSAIGTGVDPTVFAIAAQGTTPSVYVGGYFTAAGNAPNTNNLARWKGPTWSTSAWTSF